MGNSLVSTYSREETLFYNMPSWRGKEPVVCCSQLWILTPVYELAFWLLWQGISLQQHSRRRLYFRSWFQGGSVWDWLAPLSWEDHVVGTCDGWGPHLTEDWRREGVRTRYVFKLMSSGSYFLQWDSSSYFLSPAMCVILLWINQRTDLLCQNPQDSTTSPKLSSLQPHLY